MVWNGVVRKKKLINLKDGKLYSPDLPLGIVDCGGEMYLSEWITPMSRAAYTIGKSSAPIREKWAIDYAAYKMPPEHLFVYSLWRWLDRESGFTYIPDADGRYPDYWNSAAETLAEHGGDCEDTSIALVSTARQSCSNWYNSNESDISGKIDLAIGFYINCGVWFGHGFVIYNSPYFKKEVVLETTWEGAEIKPNAYIELAGSHYHPTVRGTEKRFTQVCDCSHCQEMMEYLVSGVQTRKDEKIKWIQPTREFKGVIVERLRVLEVPIKKPWWRPF